MRLIRGLSSDREEAKKGFFSALVAFLKIKRDTEVVQEARDIAAKHLRGHGESKSVSNKGNPEDENTKILTIYESTEST